jgi:uncharacterized protein YrrD
MKKTQEILGLPIISISDGTEVGKVKSIIVNADKGAIDYIVVDSGIQILSARVIPTDNILGVGEYALTIENDAAINDIGKIPAAIDLLQKNIQVKGTKVLTKRGRLIGEIGDFYINENECFKITGLEYIADITQKRIRLIPRDSVITFGKNLVVVNDDVESVLLDRPTQLGSGDKTAESEKKNLVNFEARSQYVAPTVEQVVTEADKIIASEGETYFNEINKNNKPYVAETLAEEAIEPEVQADLSGSETVLEKPVSVPDGDSTAANLFEQRQKQYLNGRKATKTITDNSGNVIVNDGNVISEEIIEAAKQCGKLIELVMNNKA